MFKQILSLMLVSYSVFASNVGFLKYGVISDFTEDDIQQLQLEYIQVLKNRKPGDVHSWQNTSTKNGGEITVIKQYKQDDKSCKRLKFKNVSKHQSAVSYFNFCLIDQRWKVVS